MWRVLVIAALAGACAGPAARPTLLEARIQPAADDEPGAPPRRGMYVRPPAALIELPVVSGVRGEVKTRAEAVRLGDLTDWIEAGLAFREAAARAGDPAFDTAAVDAWANGVAVAARATPAQRARLRGVLEEVTGPEGPRARTLAASLR